tara:strand:- start:185 stop:832 length:648 start_codon:yes stop_codon:yes gene_type:complete
MRYNDKKENIDGILCPFCDQTVGARGQGALRNHIKQAHSESFQKFFCVPSNVDYSFTHYIFLLDLINCWNRDKKETSDWFEGQFSSWYNLNNLVEIFCRRPASDLYDDDVEILKKSFKYKKKIPLSKLICHDELFKVNKAIKNRISYEEIIFGNVLGSTEEQIIKNSAQKLIQPIQRNIVVSKDLFNKIMKDNDLKAIFKDLNVRQLKYEESAEL